MTKMEDIMKKLLLVSALALPAFSAMAQDLPPGLPGLGTEAAPVAEEAQIQRPDALRILADISPELRLSSRQEERITAAIDKKGKEFDGIFKEYEKADAEEKKWRYKVNDFKYKMNGVNRSIPDVVRDFLDDEQRQNFDALLEARRNPKPVPLPEVKQEEKPAPAPAAAEEPKPAVPAKKKLVKRKKLVRPAAAPANVQSPAAAPAAEHDTSALPPEEAGTTMVDKDSSAVNQAPAPKKKRVLKKKIAAPKAAGDNLAPGQPAGAAPTGKEAPAADDEAGSYP